MPPRGSPSAPMIDTCGSPIPPGSLGDAVGARDLVEDRVAERRHLAVVGLDHLARGDHRVDALVRLGEDLLERAVDGVGEHVGARRPSSPRARSRARSAPCGAFAPRGCAARSPPSGRPASSGRGPAPGSPRRSSRTIRPSTSTTTRSAIAAAAASWVTMTTVWPNSSTARRSRASTSSLERESRLPVGSSAKTTAGLASRARAIATRCCWPPESSAGRWASRSPSPTAAISASQPLRVGLAAGELQRQQDVLLGAQHRQQVEELKDEADLVAAQLGQLAVVEVAEVDAVDRHPCPRSAGRGRRGCASGSTCPSPTGPMIAVERRLGEVDADPVEGAHGGLALAEHASHVGRSDDRRNGCRLSKDSFRSAPWRGG